MMVNPFRCFSILSVYVIIFLYETIVVAFVEIRPARCRACKIFLHAESRKTISRINFVPKPLPMVLGGGLFLFLKSVKEQDKDDARVLLAQCQDFLQKNPTVTMELGQGIETGGVYSSLSSESSNAKQLALQFQIEGGNAWAQGLAYGIKELEDEEMQLVSLEVANMDASMNGTPFDVPIPKTTVE